MPDYYAGIGSRKTPPDTLDLIERVAWVLSEQDYTLRSGHADGADYAFEKGANGNAQIFLPWPSFNDNLPLLGTPYTDPPSPEAMEIAEQYHPSWRSLSQGARKLHARNCHQILGPDLDDPVSFVLCWTPGGQMKGGTAQALRIANDYDISITNMGTREGYDLVMDYLR